MADTKLADLTALTTPSGDDILYIVDDPAGTPLDRKIALDNLFTRGTITADAPVLNMSQTWNNNAVTFTGLKFNATDTASAAASNLLDIGTGGGTYVSRFSVKKNGDVTFASTGGTVSFSGSVGFDFGTFQLLKAASISFGPSNDVIIGRRTAANIRFGSIDAAGSAIAISSVATNQLTLASSHGLTSGAAVIITGTTAPSGTSLNTLYYARSISAAVIELYLTFDAATATSGTTGIVAVTTAGTSASIRLSTPFQRLSPQDFTGTDIPGQPLLINGSRGTGTGPGGSIIFQVAPAGGSGAAQNALATALTINADKTVTFAAGAAFASFAYFATNKVAINQNGTGDITAAAAGEFCFGSTGVNSPDVRLFRDAANTLALRNGTNAQAFNVYNTFTDASNYERLAFVTGAAFEIQAQAAGTGTGKSIQIKGGSGAGFFFGGGGAVQWQVNSSGNFLAQTDNTYDIGASGATRPRNVYVAASVVAGANIFAGGTNAVIISSRMRMSSPANGNLLLLNDASDNFGLLMLGGTDANFPALKRNGTALETKLANDTAYAPHAMQYLDVTDGVTAPASATGRARIYVDTADGDLKVIFADGTVKTIVTDT
jgi:hypothetical protein